MGQFFTSWATWEKLVFLLACAIVITILGGCLKLAHAHWKVQKYSTVAAEQDKKEQTLLRQMSQRRRKAREDDEVPFGIRAIESGIEVEGVWISRGNTPEPVSRDGSEASLWDANRHGKTEPGSSGMLGHQTSDPAASVTVPVESYSLSSDGSTQTTQLPFSNNSRDSSPARVTSWRPAMSRYPPSTLSTTSQTSRSVSEISVYEGFDAIRQASGPMADSQHNPLFVDDGLSSPETSPVLRPDIIDSDPIAASAPKLLNNHPPSSRSRDSSRDFDLMQLHRKSQAAEMGQLAPRLRRSAPVESSKLPREWTEASQRAERASTRVSVSNPFSTPQPQPEPDYVPLQELPQHVETASPATQDSTWGILQVPAESLHYAPLTSIGPSAPEVRSSSLDEDSVQHSRSTPSRFRRSLEVLPSAVIRGQGTGFEILKPGTLRPSPSSATPPSSLQKYGDSGRRSGSRERGRKLQKKNTRRDSSGSEASLTRVRAKRPKSVTRSVESVSKD